MGTKAGKAGKLTLSVAPKFVAMLRKAGARRGKSITELVEELAVELDEGYKPGTKGQQYLERNLGVLAKKVKPSDWTKDDRIGDLLRKHVPR